MSELLLALSIMCNAGNGATLIGADQTENKICVSRVLKCLDEKLKSGKYKFLHVDRFLVHSECIYEFKKSTKDR